MKEETKYLKDKLLRCRSEPGFFRYPEPLRRKAAAYASARAKQGASPRQVADELGVSQTTITAWLKRAAGLQGDAGAGQQATEPSMSFEQVWFGQVRPSEQAGDVASKVAGLTVQLLLTDGTTMRVEGLSESGVLEAMRTLSGRQR